MKTFMLIALFAFSVSANAQTLWEQYLLHPAPENANAVKKIEYTEGAIPDKYNYWYPDLILVKNQINAGDAASFNLALRLLNNSDGGLYEDLSGVISSAIRSQPKMFLVEITKSNISREALKFILNYTGDEYVDRMAARNYEIKMRKKAINSISNKELKETKKLCLSMMVIYK